MTKPDCTEQKDLPGPDVVEFNWPLFVYQRRAPGEGEYLFTIAVWKGTRLLPICHLQPFQTALAALGEALIEAGRSQSGSATSVNSDSNDFRTQHQAIARADAKSPSVADGNGRP